MQVCGLRGRGHPAGALAGNRPSTCPLQDLRTANEALANELVRVSSSGEKVRDSGSIKCGRGRVLCESIMWARRASGQMTH